MPTKKPDLSGKRKPPAEKIPANADFVRAWQTSETVDEAAAALGIPEHAGWCSVKAGAMRRIGVRLKEMRKVWRPEKTDVEALNALVDELEATA